jgi:hypothetical protein
MYRIEGLDIICNEVDEFGHGGFDTSGISGCVRCIHEHAV